MLKPNLFAEMNKNQNLDLPKWKVILLKIGITIISIFTPFGSLKNI